VELEPAAERLDAIGEPAQPAAGAGVGAADPVVAHLDPQSAARAPESHADRRGLGMPGGVGQGLRDEVVGGGLDSLWEALAQRLELDRHGRSRGERLERRSQPALAQDRGVDAAGQLAQLVQRETKLLPRRCEQLLGGRRVLVEPRLDIAQVERHAHEALLGAVVEVALDAPPFGVGGLDQAGA
jgi:hypothetical protein